MEFDKFFGIFIFDLKSGFYMGYGLGLGFCKICKEKRDHFENRKFVKWIMTCFLEF